MKLLFVGLKPGKALSAVLHSNGFHCLTGEGSETPDLIAIAPKAAAGIKELAKLRDRYPRAWIAAVVGRKWLASADLFNALLRCEQKNDIWFEDIWEATFWLGIQRALAAGRTEQEVDSIRAEMRRLKAHYAELSASSDRLIRQLEKDVSLATNIQRSLLPKSSPVIPGVSLAVKYLPAAGLGGDYYDIFELDDRRRFGVLIADSKTHGMAAALLSVLLKTRIDEMKERFPATHSFIDYLNRELQGMKDHGKKPAKPPAKAPAKAPAPAESADPDDPDGEFTHDLDDEEDDPKPLPHMAVLYGILDRSTLTFRFTAAGHLRPILWRAGEPEPVNVASNPPLGSHDHFAFRETQLQLRPGDLLILHTDGLDQPLTDRPASAGPLLTAFEQVAQVLRNSAPSPDPLEVQNELMALIDQFVERKPLSDDLTLIHLAIDRGALYVAPSGIGPTPGPTPDSGGTKTGGGSGKP